MQCPRCQTENREGRRFCGECGLSFASSCALCGFLNEDGEKFCGGCGAALVSAPTSAAARPGSADTTSTPPISAERRQLTVMFCDLVGSTPLSGRLDPEALRDLVRSYQRVCGDVIGHFDGHVAQYLGDGLLVYFGYPVAHEDDAERAVRSGLGIIAAMERSNAHAERDHGVRLAVRLGIHTGLVVVGEVGSAGRHETLALGETPNIAARIQGLAAPDTVVVSAATHRLVEPSFVCVELGPQTVKGLAAPIHVFSVRHERDRHAIAQVPLTPLIGREQEIGLLLDRWEQARDGLGQIVLISGEPGIGKSRLVQALKERVAREAHARWECRCSPYHRDSPLHPVIEQAERALEFGPEESAAEKLAKIVTASERYRLSGSEAVSLWASLLSVPMPDGHPPMTLTPARQKQKTLEAILELLLALAMREPLLFIVEDLHWIDPSSLELLGLVVDQVAAAPVLTVLTARPDFRPPWAPRAHLAQLTVNRFTRRQTELMVERVVGGKSLPADVMQQVVARTDGVPLFVEELTKMVVESGLVREHGDRYELTGALPARAIPATLQDSLMARLDRLASVKDVAQIGAALGRAFSYDLLQMVADLDETALGRSLTTLVEAEFLHQRGVPPHATYIFKHALIQEAAYQSMLITRRRQLHKRIVQALLERFTEIAETQPELVAHHYTEAGLAEPAAAHWQRAGQRAIRRSANLEAIGHLSRGLEVLASLPATPAHARQELELQIALGPLLMVIKGYAAPEVERTYARARTLCREVDDTPLLLSVLWGLWYFHLGRAQWTTARELAEQLFGLVERVEDRGLHLLAHRVLGQTLSFMGELLAARSHLDQAIALYDPQAHRPLAFVYGEDQSVVCQSWAALGRWLLGYPAQALALSAATLEFARGLSHPRSLLYALNWAAMLHLYRRDAPAVQARAEEIITLAAEQGITLWGASGTLLRGWALAQQGDVDAGIAQIHQGIDVWRKALEAFHPYFLGLLAEAHLRAGRAHEGLPIIADALAVVDRSGERYYEIELYRLEGELRLQLRDPDEQRAAVCFDQALALARHRQMKSFELRAATSLSRLLAKQGKRADAQRLLAGSYGSFTEGFDTPDLTEARALFDELKP